MFFKCEYCKNRDGANCQSCKGYQASNGRDETLKRLADEYGIKYNSKILNIVKASEKVLFKDLCRVFNISSSLANKITTNNAISEALENHEPVEILISLMEVVVPDAEVIFREALENIDYVYECSGMIYGSSIHASGVILSETPINIPNSEGTCHANGHYCEELGYIKFDLLSLTNLDAVEAIKGLEIEWDDVKKESLDYIAEKELDFVFQFGSPVVDEMVHGVSKDKINILNLSDITSINRPGPLGIHLNETWVKTQNGDLPLQEEATDTIEYLREKGILKI